MRKEVSAGGIVFRVKDEGIEVLIIHDSYGKIAFPKGHQEKGETLEETALRETQEETNLENLKLITKIGTTKFWFTFGGERIHKTLHLYLFKLTDVSEEPSPQWEIQDCQWVKIGELGKLKVYDNLKPMIRKAIKLIYQNKDQV